MEQELNQILLELGMDPCGSRREFQWLKEVIGLAVCQPSAWQESYLELIGMREGITRERVRQILYRVVWDHWTPQSAQILSNHFGRPVQTQFERVKPNHIEFVNLLAEKLLEKYGAVFEQVQSNRRVNYIKSEV